jgi:hypothetical protein
MLAHAAISPLSKPTVATRIFAACVALACLAVLVTAASLSPSTLGHGTHTQLGMPACAWAVRFNKPCPMCGMTTSFAHAANFEWRAAVVAQPMGAFLAILAGVVFWIALHTALFGSALASLFLSLLKPKLVWTLLAALIAAWLYKISTWQPY